MKRRIRDLIGIDAARVDGTMIALVPAPRADVESTQKGDLAVDHDEFLVMAGAERMVGIEAELDALIGVPFEMPALQPFPIDAVNHAEVPGENVHAQVGVAFTKTIEKRKERAVGRGGAIVAQELHVAVELPAGQEDVSLSLCRRSPKSAIVVAAIDQQAALA